MGCICLDSSNKITKVSRITKQDGSINLLSSQFITVHHPPFKKEQNRPIYSRISTRLLTKVFQFLEYKDLHEIANCNQELRELLRNPNLFPRKQKSSSIMNNQTHLTETHNQSLTKDILLLNTNIKPKVNHNLNDKSKEGDSNIVSFPNKVYHTHSFIKKLSTTLSPASAHEKNINKQRQTILSFTNEQPVINGGMKEEDLKSIRMKKCKERQKNSCMLYEDAFTKEQIDLSKVIGGNCNSRYNSNNCSINKRSVSNVSMDWENNTPSFSEECNHSPPSISKVSKGNNNNIVNGSVNDIKPKKDDKDNDNIIVSSYKNRESKFVTNDKG